MKFRTLLSLAALLSINYLYAQCNAFFQFTGPTATGGIAFYDSSSSQSGQYTVEWDFGDGTNSTSTRPIHNYNSIGSYTVCLSIYDSINNCRDTICNTVMFKGQNPSCGANFTYNYNQNSYRTINFINNSTSASSYKWVFGDGDSSTATNPSHTYAADTTYTACLTTYDSSGNICSVKCLSVHVGLNSGGGCNADFQYYAGNSLYSMTFANTSSSSNGTYYWDMGDGTTFTNTSPGTYTYSGAGTYYVLLKILQNGAVCDSVGKYVWVDSVQRCYINFNYYRSQNLSRQIYFDNKSFGASSYQWYFGDGATDTAFNPVHTYAKDSTYNVCLVGYDNAGNFCDSACINVKAGTGSNTGCQASYYVYQDSLNKYKLHIIENSTYSATASVNYLWSFGDGDSSTSSNPSHQYASYGKYELCLTIWNNNTNCSSTYCDSIGIDSTGVMRKKGGFEIEVTNETLSIDDITASTITLYPNPGNGVINLKWEASNDDLVISVLDIRGVTLMQNQFKGTSAKASLDISSVSQGLYIIQVQQGNSIKTLKYLKH